VVFYCREIYGVFAAETEDLRAFRDRILRLYAVGRKFIRVYYRMSPVIAAWLSKSSALRAVTRTAMRPAVWAARRLLRHVNH